MKSSFVGVAAALGVINYNTDVYTYTRVYGGHANRYGPWKSIVKLSDAIRTEEKQKEQNDFKNTRLKLAVNR